MLRHKTLPYLFIIPAMLFFVVFIIYPVISSFILSFQKQVGPDFIFVGLENYSKLFKDPTFYTTLTNTLIIFIIQVPVMLFLSIILASALNSKALKFKGIFRTSLIMPYVTSLVATAILFGIMMQTNGLLNGWLSKINVSPVPWLTDGAWAKISIIIIMTWRYTGYNMVVFLAALQNIPEDLYEASSIDGAGKVRQFFSITIPSLKPIILFTGVLSTIGTLQLFDEPYNLTNGGPMDGTMTFGLYIYRAAFQNGNFGYASAISYVLVVIIVILTLIQFKVTGDEDNA